MGAACTIVARTEVTVRVVIRQIRRLGRFCLTLPRPLRTMWRHQHMLVGKRIHCECARMRCGYSRAVDSTNVFDEDAWLDRTGFQPFRLYCRPCVRLEWWWWWLEERWRAEGLSHVLMTVWTKVLIAREAVRLWPLSPLPEPANRWARHASWSPMFLLLLLLHHHHHRSH